MLGAQAKYILIFGQRLSQIRSKNTGQITYCKDNVIHRTWNEEQFNDLLL